MFTGIIEEVGVIRGMSMSGHSGEISIKAGKVLEGTKIGDSIAVNGICLTVTSLRPDGFTAGYGSGRQIRRPHRFRAHRRDRDHPRNEAG